MKWFQVKTKMLNKDTAKLLCPECTDLHMQYKQTNDGMGVQNLCVYDSNSINTQLFPFLIVRYDNRFRAFFQYMFLHSSVLITLNDRSGMHKLTAHSVPESLSYEELEREHHNAAPC